MSVSLLTTAIERNGERANAAARRLGEVWTLRAGVRVLDATPGRDATTTLQVALDRGALADFRR